MKRCPKCGSAKLLTTAHVVQEYWMDGDQYDQTIEDCIEVAHYPDNEDLWSCRNCGYEAAGIEFEEVK